MTRKRTRRGCKHVIVEDLPATAYIVRDGVPVYVCDDCKKRFAAVADEPGQFEEIKQPKKQRSAVG